MTMFHVMPEWVRRVPCPWAPSVFVQHGGPRARNRHDVWPGTRRSAQFLFILLGPALRSDQIDSQ